MHYFSMLICLRLSLDNLIEAIPGVYTLFFAVYASEANLKVFSPG
jgi:hypothetical protein